MPEPLTREPSDGGCSFYPEAFYAHTDPALSDAMKVAHAKVPADAAHRPEWDRIAQLAGFPKPPGFDEVQAIRGEILNAEAAAQKDLVSRLERGELLAWAIKVDPNGTINPRAPIERSLWTLYRRWVRGGGVELGTSYKLKTTMLNVLVYKAEDCRAALGPAGSPLAVPPSDDPKQGSKRGRSGPRSKKSEMIAGLERAIKEGLLKKNTRVTLGAARRHALDGLKMILGEIPHEKLTEEQRFTLSDLRHGRDPPGMKQGAFEKNCKDWLKEKRVRV